MSNHLYISDEDELLAVMSNSERSDYIGWRQAKDKYEERIRYARKEMARIRRAVRRRVRAAKW